MNGEENAAINCHLTREWIAFDSTQRIDQFGQHIEGHPEGNLMSQAVNATNDGCQD